MNWTIVFSGVVTASTLAYVCLNAWLTIETRRMRRVQTEPKIGVSLVPSPFAIGFVDMIVRNDGAGPALNIRFEVVETGEGTPDPELVRMLKSFGLVQAGIPYLSPGAEFRTYVAQVLGRSEAQTKTNVHLRVSYSSSGGERYSDCYPMTLTQFWNRAQIGTDPLVQIARELAALRETIKTSKPRTDHETGLVHGGPE